MLGRSSPNVGTIFHFRADLAFVQVQDRSRSEKLSGSVKVTHHPSSILGDGLNLYAPLQILCYFETKELSRMVDSSSCLLSIDIDGSSGILQ